MSSTCHIYSNEMCVSCTSKSKSHFFSNLWDTCMFAMALWLYACVRAWMWVYLKQIYISVNRLCAERLFLYFSSMFLFIIIIVCSETGSSSHIIAYTIVLHYDVYLIAELHFWLFIFRSDSTRNSFKEWETTRISNTNKLLRQCDIFVHYAMYLQVSHSKRESNSFKCFN